MRASEALSGHRVWPGTVHGLLACTFATGSKSQGVTTIRVSGAACEGAPSDASPVTPTAPTSQDGASSVAVGRASSH